MSRGRPSSILIRLQSWRDVAVYGSPEWLAEIAPKVIQQLEAEIAAEARTRNTPDSQRGGA